MKNGQSEDDTFHTSTLPSKTENFKGVILSIKVLPSN